MPQLPASAARVADALRQLGVAAEVRQVSDSTRSAAEAAAVVGCEVAQIVKSLVFRRVATDEPVLVLASGADRVDESRLAEVAGGPVERPAGRWVRDRTGYAIGGIPPLGHLEPVTTYLDQHLLAYPVVWAAAGTPHAVFAIAPDELLRATGAAVVAIAAASPYGERTMTERPAPEAGLHGAQREAATARRAELAARYLRPRQARPASSARGVHHVALLSSDVAATVEFYQGLLEFPLTDMFENRDYGGSTHFFFDIGHGNAIAFFDLPGLDLGPYREVLGGLHHLAISVEPERWNKLRAKLDGAGVPYQHIDGSSLYFHDPDGARLELISDPLGEMYGSAVV